MSLFPSVLLGSCLKFADQLLSDTNAAPPCPSLYGLSYPEGGIHSTGNQRAVFNSKISDPANLRVLQLDEHSVTVAWDAVGMVDFYRVHRCRSGSDQKEQVAETQQLFFTDTELDAGTTYIYSVVAYHEPSLDHSAGDSTLTVTTAP